MLSGLLLDAKAGEYLLNDGFVYPSVAHRGGLNFANRPERFDATMEWEGFVAVEITDSLGFGLYGTRKYAEATVVDDKGEIAWGLLKTN